MYFIGRELTEREKQMEDEIWHQRILDLWGIDTDMEPTEDLLDAKRKMSEYQHKYYIEHRQKSVKVLKMDKVNIKNRVTQSRLRNRPCLYEGETIKHGTLMARLHNKLGYSWPDAKIIADQSLIIKGDENCGEEE